MAVAWTFHAMSRYSPDVLKSHSTAILPVVFLAMHQEVSKGIVGCIEFAIEILSRHGKKAREKCNKPRISKKMRCHWSETETEE